MITIFELSRESYTKILKVMPQAIKGTEQDYDTVTIKLSSVTNIETNNHMRYVTLTCGLNRMAIDFNQFHYIAIS